MNEAFEDFHAAREAAREAWSHALRGSDGDTNRALAHQADAMMRLISGLINQLSDLQDKVGDLHREMERRAHE